MGLDWQLASLMTVGIVRSAGEFSGAGYDAADEGELMDHKANGGIASDLRGPGMIGFGAYFTASIENAVSYAAWIACALSDIERVLVAFSHNNPLLLANCLMNGEQFIAMLRARSVSGSRLLPVFTAPDIAEPVRVKGIGWIARLAAYVVQTIAALAAICQLMPSS